MMLHEFLTSNRQMIISLCKEKVAKRRQSPESQGAIDYGVPLFLQQLVDILRVEQNMTFQSRESRNNDSEPTPAATPIGRSAALHGADLLRRGFSIDQVVHDYGDLCQCVTGLAVEQNVSISADEFRTFNRCLDNAMADAVASFGSARQTSIDHEAESLQQRLIGFAAERRRLIDIAIRSLTAIKTGNIGINGATGALLAHALEELRAGNDEALTETLLAFPGAKSVPS